MSNSNHDPKNKECAIYGEEHEKEIECEHPCTCRPEQKEEVVHASGCAADLDGCYDGSCLVIPEQNMEEKKCMCGEHQLGYFIISERIGETIHSRESPCWIIEKEDHTKCRKLGTSDLCVCCPCGCDTPMDAPNYAELHGAPTEQKEEWEEEFDKEFVKYATGSGEHFNWGTKPPHIKDFIRTQLALSEERGRREVITENTSDGYHTFKELYDHRIMLFIALCRAVTKQLSYSFSSSFEGGFIPPIWRSKRHSDGELCFGTGTQFVLGIGKSNGNQITYHIPIERWDETDFAETLETAPEWDGHTSDDVIQRLKNL